MTVRKTSVLERASLAAGILGAAWGVAVWFLGPRGSPTCCVTVLDANGRPANVEIVGPHGEVASTDAYGVARFSCQWLPGSLSIRDPGGREEVAQSSLDECESSCCRISLFEDRSALRSH